jgi:hypothetical protein
VLLPSLLLLLLWRLLTFRTNRNWRLLLVVLWLCSIYLHRHGLNLTLLTSLVLLLVVCHHAMAALSRLPCSCCSWPPRRR